MTKRRELFAAFVLVLVTAILTVGLVNLTGCSHDKKAMAAAQSEQPAALANPLKPPAQGSIPVAFLLSDGGSGITGETIYVDCGYNIMGF